MRCVWRRLRIAWALLHAGCLAFRRAAELGRIDLDALGVAGYDPHA